MHIWLLTHSEELKKANGTGQIVTHNLGEGCSVIVWQRTEPSELILQLPADKTLLIYPRSEDDKQTEGENIEIDIPEHVIILDGTWQQARKMYNRSPYLHIYQKFEIQDQHSRYIRRRNQLEKGLCTAETAIYLLNRFGSQDQAQELEQAFLEFNQQQT